MSASEYDQSLYLPEYEKDACGIGLIAQLKSEKSPQIVCDALTMLENMEHRGACGCEENTGDGAGILTQIPHNLFRKYALAQGHHLPDAGEYAVGFLFLPKDTDLNEEILNILNQILEQNYFKLLFIRDVPVDNSMIGASALATEPKMVQFFVQPLKHGVIRKDMERRLYVLRNHIVRNVVRSFPFLKEVFYFASFSSLTIIYKGQLTALQVRQYFPDLSDDDYTSAIALVHSRFSTNTVPKWKLAQPFRCIAHNGEINTVKGNVNWWTAREKDLVSDIFSEEDLKKLLPVCSPTLSDSGNFDAVLEFLFRSGYSMPHALMMMIPEAFQNDENMAAYKKDFYKYYEPLMEPWDGPASICFSDGVLVGATVDRNGLRPSKYCLTNDDRLILASESGVLALPQENIIYKANLSPGKILIADLDQGKIVGDEELKAIICQRYPYGKWNDTYQTPIDKIQEVSIDEACHLDLLTQQIAHGHTKEDRDIILASMMASGYEPVSSMGSDIPLAVLSHQSQHISNYFKQEFAQVTNPPIDPLREKFYMTLDCYLGGEGDILTIKPENAKKIFLTSPILDKSKYLKVLNSSSIGYMVGFIQAICNADDEGHLKKSIFALCEEAASQVKTGTDILVINNTDITESKAAIPSMMIVGAIHHHLITNGLRRRVSLVVNGGDIIEAHHVACLLSFGADAVYPSLTIKTIQNIAVEKAQEPKTAIKNYLKAIDSGLLKIMSKLGISTVNSYKAAQTFEALGIHKEVMDICFKGAVSRIGGMTFDMLAKEQLHKHFMAFSLGKDSLTESGKYQWKQRGEYHLFNPTSVHLLQHATKTNNYATFKKYTAEVNDQSTRACTLRSLFEFKAGNSIPIDEVEPIENIMRRFATGAMSFGSISEEAHTTLAIAMNRIGGKSNSGEGGEDARRYKKLANGDSTRSVIKQVASGRFGVTIEYLNNADEIQIKMAQGAKPGEGGQLPGHKVDANIARIRHSTEGVGLISPPPHHDIYSIEDLAQLIFDLKNANSKARISVKLVAKAGVGIIASGVAKAHADHILISGFDGGTGASPLSSIMHAGIPWELGLAETHQTLVKNKLRDRVTLQTDGQIRTAKDMAVATMLGAEEWGIATAALVVSGCILMRKCHLNTCPVGIATQDETLRAKYDGKVEYLVNYFTFLAMEMREIMANLGFCSVDEMVGRSDMLTYDVSDKYWKYRQLDLSPILFRPEADDAHKPYKSFPQDHGIDQVLDRKLIQYSELAIEDKVKISSVFQITSTDRSVGTMLSGNIAQKYGADGLPNGSLDYRFKGSAGQSFGAFGIKGLHFILEGEANDYFGKGLSGATLIITPDRAFSGEPSENIIVGNVALFGATSGQVFIKGRAGQRFAVRNSGASAVVEGVGDNACEYMTGGTVIILGSVCRNFAAGMSGGIAYVYDQKVELNQVLNREMVILDAMSETDYSVVKELLRDHFRYTGSMAALEILNDWEASKKRFSKVMPIEYKAILERKSVVKVYNKVN
ncbi:MAG: glutamate synthase large subunit [Saprospiraceae bacterium]|nr:glutamate synthase large subunit [Saprospiraceae bacterium]